MFYLISCIETKELARKEEEGNYFLSSGFIYMFFVPVITCFMIKYIGFRAYKKETRERTRYFLWLIFYLLPFI